MTSISTYIIWLPLIIIWLPVMFRNETVKHASSGTLHFVLKTFLHSILLKESFRFLSPIVQTCSDISDSVTFDLSLSHIKCPSENTMFWVHQKWQTSMLDAPSSARCPNQCDCHTKQPPNSGLLDHPTCYLPGTHLHSKCRRVLFWLQARSFDSLVMYKNCHGLSCWALLIPFVAWRIIW